MSLFQEQLRDKKIIITCGTGGVGKTSISAALALYLAQAGKKVGLVTIDPAKRLASAMGLKNLSSQPQILNACFASELSQPFSGSISALMFDAQLTLDNFVEATAGREIFQLLRENNLYQIISSNFSGTHEYLALEKLYELETQHSFDVIVLDTPPARHTLDFLDAPEKIAAFFDDRIFQWFLTDPRSTGILEKIRAKGTKGALLLLEKLTGQGVLHDFTQIAPHLYKLKNSFVARQLQIQNLLRSEATGALFVTTGLALVQQDFRSFREDAIQRGIRPTGLIVNRSLAHLCGKTLHELELELNLHSVPKIIQQNYINMQSIVAAENHNIAAIKKSLKETYPIVRLPELGQNIQQIKALIEMSQCIGNCSAI